MAAGLAYARAVYCGIGADGPPVLRKAGHGILVHTEGEQAPLPVDS